MINDLPTSETYYPSEIHRLLRIGDNLIVPNNTPVVNDQVEEQTEDTQSQKHELHPIVVTDTPPVWVKLLRSNFVLYPAIFLVAFLFFYSVLNFQSLTTQVSGWFAPAEDEQILGENLTEYYAWMGGYYFAVGNRESLEPSGDSDRDGLSNMDEFVLRTNPIMPDSDDDGITDGIEVINSSNFWGDGGMSEKQKKLVAGLDMIKINNRISFNVATNSSQNILGATKVNYDKVNYDLDKPGRLSVPKLGLQVPLIWTMDAKDFDVDLTRGVVHYPGTALPGEQGTVYVSGHSSDYPWKRHPFKQVFAKINSLEPGDDIFVDIYGLDGKLYNYRYRVASKNVYKPDDQTQFIDNSAAKLNLSTCWPIGTLKDRYVVTAILEGV